ncbi:pimeloyl-ACP methyl ester carboxylesterase [Kitasatospora gansuensis]|uniref:Pimeloyl-ACP methyl ester carboxylesterase n=1 Tax=Kitasatospora gansuensis TaxID=258050 RepID=A0A7W7WHQ3_9ACTN|nr:alpha/beta hydrolase [Kitasatospora gansuensis]MBB4947997.1 pimeloyl-ACP methyl ester carboxylesterase [Kitasatospora gansuensis]
MDLSAALLRTALNATATVSPRAAGQGAFALFHRPVLRSRIRPDEREQHDRAVTEQLTVGAREVTSYRWGSGERPVLLVHGWRSRASRFAPMIPRLQALGLSPVAFDAPGHGDSGGRTTTILDYREVIGRLHDRYGPFEAVVAHSLGAAGAFLALREGVKAGRVVTIAGVAEYGFLVEAFRVQLGLGRWAGPELERRVAEVLAAGRDRADFDPVHRPGDFDFPMLAVHDRDDRVVLPGQADLFRAAYGERLQLLTTEGLGHSRILAEPTVLDHVAGFLAAE